MNRAQLERLRDKIEALDTQEHAQIFDVIKRYTASYTKTQNGVLIASDSLPLDCLTELDRMVSFYADQRKRMETDTLERKSFTGQSKTD